LHPLSSAAAAAATFPLPQIPFDKVFGKDKTPASFGPFTQTAELINGRAAMLGLAALFFIEGTAGQPFFL
jgi:hypothetical protein